MQAKQRITLFTIDSMMAMTHRYELEIRQPLEPKPVGYAGRQLRVALVRQRGKRRDQYLDLDPDAIVLDGWDVPFRTDTESGGVCSGNACFNLVGDPAVIRQWIETRAVLPVSDQAKAKIVVQRGARTRCDDSGAELLYPDIPTHHAVIDRLREELGYNAVITQP
jgi:hypothetical protein